MGKKKDKTPKTGKKATPATPVRKTSPPSAYVVTGRQLADLFAAEQGKVVNLRTIQRWHTEGKMPRIGPDRYDLPKVIAWRAGQIRREYSQVGGDERRLLKAQADKETARARLLDLERRNREGELLEADEVEAGRLERIVAVRSGMLFLWMTISERIVSRSGGALKTADVQQVVGQEVDKLLLSFAGPAALANGAVTPVTAAETAPKKRKRTTRGKKK